LVNLIPVCYINLPSSNKHKMNNLDSALIEITSQTEKRIDHHPSPSHDHHHLHLHCHPKHQDSDQTLSLLHHTTIASSHYHCTIHHCRRAPLSHIVTICIMVSRLPWDLTPKQFDQHFHDQRAKSARFVQQCTKLAQFLPLALLNSTLHITSS
jgi:hypothetical protein